jgi:hypothetical protein
MLLGHLHHTQQGFLVCVRERKSARERERERENVWKILSATAPTLLPPNPTVRALTHA